LLDLDMLSIGEIAHATGVSRRMLRHWEEVGLLTPAAVDELTGYRQYASSQVGRVGAIAALRALGFGLDAIGDLLDAQLSEERLVELLRIREGELVAQIDEASARLAEVRTRLIALKKGRDTIMNNLELGALPALRLAAVSTSVGDESDIGAAVADLLPRLRRRLASQGIADSDVILTYDGTADDAIVVTAGVPAPGEGVPGLDLMRVDGADHGVTVRFDPPPANIGDAWIALDGRLDEHGQETTNVYRHTITRDGAVILQAPVRPRRPCD
jgi:DNA-binding transcriptional MerR regulator